MGCTDCGRKGGCDHRKQGMFAALDVELARLYPTRRWDERDDTAALAGADASADDGAHGEAPAADDADVLADALARRLKTLVLAAPGDADEWCDYLYVLCVGRTPAIVEVRAGAAPAPGDWVDDAGISAAADGEGAAPAVEERYLRLALSAVGRYAAVQEVAMSLARAGDALVITEQTRSGVFDPVLLPRMQALVAVLAEHDIRHLDYGELLTEPEGFDPGSYPERYGAGRAPVLANYLFSPRPPATVTTTAIAPDAPPASGRASL